MNSLFVRTNPRSSLASLPISFPLNGSAREVPQWLYPAALSFFLLVAFFLLVGLLLFVLTSFVSAQEIEKERALEILSSRSGPGGCVNEAGCREFCDNPENTDTCVNWAKENGLMSDEHAEKAKKFVKLGREFEGPGGCRSRGECEGFCRIPENQDVCLDFAANQGFIRREEVQRIKELRKEAQDFARQKQEDFRGEPDTDLDFDKDKARELLETQGGPGGCTTFEECEEFCNQEKNQSICFDFAEQNGLFKNKEKIEGIKKIIKEGGPGGCRGEKECRAFCENPDNFEICIDFAKKHRLMRPEDAERAERGARALKEGGPAGCRTQKECAQVCQNPDNQEVCFEWARKHRLMSEEELQRIEEFKKRGEEMRREMEERREEFEHRKEEFERQSFSPPGEFLGPGGCVGAQECREYCEDPANKEECEKSFRTPSNIQPPGFGGTPPAAPESEFTGPKEEFNPAERCSANGGFWTGSACEFRKEEFNSIEEKTILQETGGYILHSFREFFR